MIDTANIVFVLIIFGGIYLFVGVLYCDNHLTRDDGSLTATSFHKPFTLENVTYRNLLCFVFFFPATIGYLTWTVFRKIKTPRSVKNLLKKVSGALDKKVFASKDRGTA